MGLNFERAHAFQKAESKRGPFNTRGLVGAQSASRPKDYLYKEKSRGTRKEDSAPGPKGQEKEGGGRPKTGNETQKNGRKEEPSGGRDRWRNELTKKEKARSADRDDKGNDGADREDSPYVPDTEAVVQSQLMGRTYG